MKQITILVLLTALLGSCTSIRKAERKLDKKPLERARYCAMNYPVQESKTTNTEYLPGKPVLVPGEPIYVTVDCDSAYDAAYKDAAMQGGTRKPLTIRVPVPVYKQVDTQAIETTVVKKDSAAIAVLQGANEQHKEEILDLRTKLDRKDKTIASQGKAMTWGLIIGLVLIIVAYLIGRFKIF